MTVYGSTMLSNWLLVDIFLHSKRQSGWDIVYDKQLQKNYLFYLILMSSECMPDLDADARQEGLLEPRDEFDLKMNKVELSFAP